MGVKYNKFEAYHNSESISYPNVNMESKYNESNPVGVLWEPI